ncbi:MAG: hypothetical protein KDC38_13755, partial [Planctomycetes bacterium]|nr:hypothetical protein [Planctomycetota bacterium]
TARATVHLPLRVATAAKCDLLGTPLSDGALTVREIDPPSWGAGSGLVWTGFDVELRPHEICTIVAHPSGDASS